MQNVESQSIFKSGTVLTHLMGETSNQQKNNYGQVTILTDVCKLCKCCSLENLELHN